MKISRLGWKIGLGALALLLAVSGWSGKPIQAEAASSEAASSSTSIGRDLSGHWAESTLQAWIQEGLLTGDESGRVEPDRTITRAELMALANRALGLKEAGALSFSDVKAGAWYANEVAIAVQAGYVSGYTDGTAKPNQKVTRQESAAMLGSLATKALGAEAGSSGEDVRYADASAIGAWSLEAVKTLARLGVLKGLPDGTFQPNSPMTRAEAIVALDRLKKLTSAPEQEVEAKVYSEAGTYGPESGQEVISGDAVVQVGGVTLRNLTIKGDLTLEKGVGEGDVTLHNVTVEGETLVLGGGANSIHFIDSIISSLIVNKEGSSIRIVAQGTTQIKQAEFRSVATFVVQTGAKVETFVVRATVKVTGQGLIVNAKLYVSGTSFETSPTNIEAAAGIQYFIGTIISGGGGSGPVIIDDAPTVTGVVYGQTYVVAVTPVSADQDIATVSLTKDGATVEGYELGDEIAVNGSYVLTVTDAGNNSTAVRFIVNIPAPDLAPVVTGVADGETYAVAVTPVSSDEDIASVTLMKDSVAVEGYDLGEEIAENGSYVLTVTDAGNHGTVVSFVLELPVQIIPDLETAGMDGTELTLNVHVTNSGETIENVVNGVRLTVPNHDGDEIYGSYYEGYASFNLYRVGDTDDFVGYFPRVYDREAGEYVLDPYVLESGWDTAVDYSIYLGQFTEAKTVTAKVWISDADAPEEENALYRMREVRIPLEANYIGALSDVEVLSATSDSVTISFTYPTGATSLNVGYGLDALDEESSSEVHYLFPYVEDIVIDEQTGKGTLELWPSFARGETFYLQMEVYGGLHDGSSNVVQVDMAPAINGVYDDWISAYAVTPSLYGTNDVESVTLTKDGIAVPGYALDTMLSENGEYVLTVTDLGGNVTTIRFTIEIRLPS